MVLRVIVHSILTGIKDYEISRIVPCPSAAMCNTQLNVYKLEHVIYLILTRPMLRKLLTIFAHRAHLAFNL